MLERFRALLPVSLVDVPGSPVTISGPSLGHDSALVSAGVSVQWTRSLSTYVSYDGQLGRDRYNSNGMRARLPTLAVFLDCVVGQLHIVRTTRNCASPLIIRE